MLQRCYVQWQMAATTGDKAINEHEAFNAVLEVVRERIDIVRSKGKQPGKKTPTTTWKTETGRGNKGLKGGGKEDTRGKGGKGEGRDSICNFWREGNTCPFGDKCRFEHSSKPKKPAEGVRFSMSEGATKEELEATITQARAKLKKRTEGEIVSGESCHIRKMQCGNRYAILENDDFSNLTTGNRRPMPMQHRHRHGGLQQDDIGIGLRHRHRHGGIGRGVQIEKHGRGITTEMKWSDVVTGEGDTNEKCGENIGYAEEQGHAGGNCRKQIGAQNQVSGLRRW